MLTHPYDCFGFQSANLSLFRTISFNYARKISSVPLPLVKFTVNKNALNKFNYDFQEIVQYSIANLIFIVCITHMSIFILAFCCHVMMIWRVETNVSNKCSSNCRSWRQAHLFYANMCVCLCVFGRLSAEPFQKKLKVSAHSVSRAWK